MVQSGYKSFSLYLEVSSFGLHPSRLVFLSHTGLVVSLYEAPWTPGCPNSTCVPAGPPGSCVLLEFVLGCQLSPQMWPFQGLKEKPEMFTSPLTSRLKFRTVTLQWSR